MARTAKPSGGEGRKASSGLRRQLMEKEILDRAAVLFAERGVAGTTLKDLADSLGMSRPSLYYYYSSKEALLQRLVENLSGRDAGALKAIRGRRDPPSERLRAMALELATNAAVNPEQSRILNRSRDQLPRELGEAVRMAERSIVRDLIGVIRDGVHSGEFRAVDAHTAAMAIIGTCIWTAWWIDSTQSREFAEAVASQVADQAVAGLVTADGRHGRDSASALLRLIRDDLDQLGRLMDGKQASA